MKLREQQSIAVDKLKNGNVLWGGVGSGKTITSLAYYMKNESPKRLFVITTAKKRDSLDWEKEAALFSISKYNEDDKRGRLTVDSWHNIRKYEDVKGAFFIFDEQKAVGKGMMAKTFVKIAKQNRWIMLSATPGDNWIDYIPLFLANGFYKNKTEFIREHVVYSYYSNYPKLERYLNQSKLKKLRSDILVEMKVERHTKRHVYIMDCDYDKELFKEVVRTRSNPETYEPFMNAAEYVAYMRKICSVDESRKKQIQIIKKLHPRIIVFYNFDYELDILRETFKDETVAEWNGHKHQPIPDTESWVYLVQYISGAEGWNCVSTDTIVFWSPTYSYKQYEQAQGRIDRLNTPYNNLNYYVLLSDSPIDKAVMKALKTKKNFNERGFLSKKTF